MLILKYDFWKTKLFLIILFTFHLIEAQEKPITGFVLNQMEQPLANVNIISQPSGAGTQTDSKGEFYFLIPIKDRSIKFEHVGYQKSVKNVILFKNTSVVIMKEKILQMDSLIVEIDKLTQFDKLNEKNNIVYIDSEKLSQRGSVDIGDALYFEQSIILNESINGHKSASVRASTSSELAYFYDGVRINRLGDPLLDLSMISTLGLTGIELLKGSHEDAISSSGSINLIPILSYKNSASFKQQFGTYDYGGYDGFGSIAFKYGTINAGLSESQFSQSYDDTSFQDLQTFISKDFLNIGIKNNKNFELKLLGFNNKKDFTNSRSGDSLKTQIETYISKLSQHNSVSGKISIYAMYQKQTGIEKLNLINRTKYSDNREMGFDVEKVIKNAKFRFSTQTSLTDLNWETGSYKIYIERQNSIFTGSFELIQTEKENQTHLKDVKIVFSNERTTDQPDTSKGIRTPHHYWSNRNSQFTISFLNKTKQKRVLYYLNISNVFRIPSLYDFVNNQTYNFYITQLDLLPEQKSTYEVGYRLIKKPNKGESSYNFNISFFNYQYLNKIKNINFSGTPVQYTINSGNASLFGFDANITLKPAVDWIEFKWILSNYYFSDPLAFQLQPEKMIRNIIAINNKWFNVDLINRSESKKTLSSISNNGTIVTSDIKPTLSYDLIIYRKLNYKFIKSSFSLSGKNLQNKKDSLNGISINDRRYTVSFNVFI